MLTMDQKYRIKILRRFEAKSIREIAKETGNDFKTVKKYVEMEDFNAKPPVKQTRNSKTNMYEESVRQWLAADLTAPRKQRHTAHRIFERLREAASNKGLELVVSERSIRTLVARLKAEITQQDIAYLPLFHPMGEAQVDFGETTFVEKGIRYEGYHLAMTFPYSDAGYTQLFKGQNLECLMQGMKNIFEHIDGMPAVIWFDNMSTAVKTIKAHGEREVTDGFYRLMTHYCFQSNFCNPASGNEKGSVENFVGYSRRNFFVPVPEFEDLQAYNRSLLEICDRDMERQHYKKEERVRDLFAVERKVFAPLPLVPFEAYKYVLTGTNNYGKASLTTNRYSTAGNLANQSVWLKIGAHTVTILNKDMKPVVTHPRLYGKNKESMLWSPYLSLVSKRPNALKYTEFFESLPEKSRNFMEQCDLDEKKKVLSFLADVTQEHSLEEALQSLEKLLQLGAQDSESLRAGYRYLTEPSLPEAKMKVSVKLPEVKEYRINWDGYMQLMEAAHESKATCSRSL